MESKQLKDLEFYEFNSELLIFHIVFYQLKFKAKSHKL